MRWKSGFCAALMAGFGLILPPGTAADSGPKLNLSGSLDNLQIQSGWQSSLRSHVGSFLREPQGTNIPQLPLGAFHLFSADWLKRVDIGAQIGDGSPRIYIETVQPLYQDSSQTITTFTQPRLSIKDGHGLYNLGFGQRQLFFDQQLLGGINGFYDFTDNHNHHRLGVGFELLSRYLEYRSNGYFPVTGSKKIKEDANQKIFERPLTGADVELGGPVPYLPFLKLYGSYAYYNYKKDIDSHIGKVRTELKLARFLRLDLDTWKDNKFPWKYRVGFVFTLNLDRPWESLASPSSEPYPFKDMRHMTLHRVVREHEIKVEQFSRNKTTGITVKIRRGT